MPEEFLTVAEVATRLKMNQQTIRNWIDRGELPAVRLGSRRVRVRTTDLDRFISDSAAARVPDEDAARAEFATALEVVQAAANDTDLGSALRSLAKAANGLARLLPRS